MHIAAQILLHARVSPQRPALALPFATVTYGQLGRGVTTLCRHLRTTSLQAGQMAAIEVANPIHHLALILALELLGVTSMAALQQQTFIDVGFMPDIVLVDGAASLRHAVPTLFVPESWFKMAPEVDPDLTGGIAAGQFHRIAFSSGTTGYPKAIGYTPSQLADLFVHTALLRGDAAGGARAFCLPAFSTIGIVTPLFVLLMGGLVGMASDPADALTLIRTLALESLAFTSVAYLELLVAAAGQAPEPLPSLRAILVTGSQVPRPLLAKVQARLCANVVTFYAATETGLMTYGRLNADTMADGDAGFVLPWVAMRAVNDSGQVLAAGETGKIEVKTPDFAAYVSLKSSQLADARAVHATAADGWFETGDIGRLTSDRHLFITGRTHEVINRGGVIIAPDYIEAALLTHPDVQEAAAFAVVVNGSHRIMAALVCRAPLDAMRLRQAMVPLLGDKTPDDFKFVESLPRTETRKLQRRVLSQCYSD